MPNRKRQPRAGTGAGGVSAGPTDDNNQAKVILPQRVTPSKSELFNFTDISALRAAWRSLAREAAKSPGLAEGIARRRSELLAGMPPYLMPSILDELNREDASCAIFM